MAEPASAKAGTLLARRAVGFVRLLRDNGFPIGLGESRDALRLLGQVDLATPHELRWGLRTLLCCSRTDWRRFDELFDAHWLRLGMRPAKLSVGGMAPGGARPRRTGPLIDHRFGPDDRAERPSEPAAGSVGEHAHRGRASRVEALGSTDLRHIHDPEEQQRVHDLAERLAARMRHRLARRRRLRSRGRRLDLRRVIHRSIQSGGTPLRLAFRRRHPKPIRLVVILDVSGSMNPYSTFFVRFLRGVLTSFASADGFVFHTRLVHLGEVLRERSSERAIERMALLAEGWSGGTRIGECLAAFNRSYAPSVLDRRSVVVIVSDGYDTGPPEQLAGQVAELKRRARRVIWLNPLLGWDGYQPLAAGMAAALPHVDLFAPAHDLESLAALEATLVRL
jgi:uncharacterized protein with von Willebrand factor type A (vWA) domain